MNEIIFQPLFMSGKQIGYFLSMNFFDMSGIIFDFNKCPKPSYVFWRNHIMDDFYTEIYNRIIKIGNDDKMKLSEKNQEIYEIKDEFTLYFMENLDVVDLYVYSHTPNKPGGYVRILTEPDENETGKLQIDVSHFYPDNVKKAGPVERFLYANTDEFEQEFRLPESMMKDSCKYCWRFGNELMFDQDIIWLYFNDTAGWNELYWDLYHVIGRPWRGSDSIEAWRESGYKDTEKKLVAEHDSQRLLFWTLENEYTLGELRRMVTEKRILTKRILGTKQDSWMTLQYGL